MPFVVFLISFVDTSSFAHTFNKGAPWGLGRDFPFSLCIISLDDIIYSHCIQSSLTLKMVSVGQIIYPIGYLPLAAQIQHGSNGTPYLLH